MPDCTKNLCAQIPATLHTEVRKQQEASGKTLSQYMTWLITEFYEMEEKQTMNSNEKRTVAFQVPVEMFEQFKEYLKANGIKQNAFFLNAIRRALEEDTAADVSH